MRFLLRAKLARSFLMCAEDALCHRAGFEQAEAEQHGIAHAPPYRADGVAACSDALYQHRIDGNADKDQQPLKVYGKQGLQIVLPGVAQFPVGERGNGDRR